MKAMNQIFLYVPRGGDGYPDKEWHTMPPCNKPLHAVAYVKKEFVLNELEKALADSDGEHDAIVRVAELIDKLKDDMNPAFI